MSHSSRSSSALVVATLGLALGLTGAAAPAVAQHCHIDVPARAAAPTHAAQAWWASVSTVLTAGAAHQTDFARQVEVTRDYQGAALALAAGWRRWSARVVLGGYRVDGDGVGVDDLHGSLAVEVIARGRVRAGLSGLASAPTGDALAGRGMGHVMVVGGAWARLGLGRTTVEASGSYARALGDWAEHAAHGRGTDGWPLIDPMNATEVAVDVNAAVAVTAALSVRAGVVTAAPIGTGVVRVVGVAGVRLERDAISLAAQVARPVVGDPYLVRGQLELGYRF